MCTNLTNLIIQRILTTNWMISQDIFQMDSILSLDMSLSMPMIVRQKHQQCMDILRTPLVLFLSEILPNLLEINLSNISTNYTETFLSFSRHCPHLKKVTWNNIINNVFFGLHGRLLKKAKNLKEIIMDDANFYDNEYHRATFLFCHCSKALERVSIRNMKWDSEVVSQDALIKFVRNVPTLRWFRSDLTIENMNMLNLERPEIVLLN